MSFRKRFSQQNRKGERVKDWWWNLQSCRSITVVRLKIKARIFHFLFFQFSCPFYNHSSRVKHFSGSYENEKYKKSRKERRHSAQVSQATVDPSRFFFLEEVLSLNFLRMILFLIRKVTSRRLISSLAKNPHKGRQFIGHWKEKISFLIVFNCWCRLHCHFFRFSDAKLCKSQKTAWSSFKYDTNSNFTRSSP